MSIEAQRDQTEQQRPILEGKAFSIDFLSPAPEGFELVTRTLISRQQAFHAVATGLVEQSEDNLTDLEKDEKVHDQIHTWRKGINQGNASEVQFQAKKNPDAHPLRQPDFEHKFNMTNVDQNGNRLVFDVTSTTYVMYNEDTLGFAKPENRAIGEKLASPTGAAMILFTTEEDGSSKMIVQHRGDNGSYKDQPGASIAGIVKHDIYPLSEVDKTKRGKPKEVTNDSIKADLRKEAEEELGIPAEYLPDIRFVGRSTDKVKIHKEILAVGKTNLTAAQVEEMAEKNLSKPQRPFNFAERMYVLPATPDAIETLTCEVECPLPPTHNANFLAAGYILMLQKEGLTAAEEWMQRVGQKALANYEHINDLIQKNTSGQEQEYNPKKKPSEQGLPSSTEALQAKGLIATEIPESKPTEEKKETERTVRSAVFIDLDGPIVAPKSREVNMEPIAEIARLLQEGIPVAANTGRSLEWVSTNIKLREYFDTHGINPSYLKNFLVVGEKGAVHYEFDEKGNPIMKTESEYSMPQDLQDTVKAIVNKYSYAMFYDKTKQTMISVEMIPDYDIEQFKIDQGLLVGDLNSILEHRNAQNKYRVSPTKIATDIEDKRVGKDLGARVIIDWMTRKGIKAASVTAIGDSTEDEKMAEEASRQGIPTTFYYVGDGELPGQQDYKVVNTEKKFTDATADILRKI